MPSNTPPSEDQPQLKAFDPLVLDRTVIALPLLRKMEEDFERIEGVDSSVLRNFNTAILYNSAFSGGVTKARARVNAMAQKAAAAAREAAAKRLSLPADEETTVVLRKQMADLENALATQLVGPVKPRRKHGFARLHAAVIRRLLAMNERIADDKPDQPRPIVAIHPERFEIIIDLNLEHPGSRKAAREWVLQNIENAKSSAWVRDANGAKINAPVRDAGQYVHWQKSLSQTQYLFARLEARAIQRLVELDMEQAKEAAAARKRQLQSQSQKGVVDAAKFRAIFHIWPDFEITGSTYKSVATVKADAAQASFSARGAGITWAVMDSGILDTHEHFKKHHNVDATSPWHRDFTVDPTGPFDDRNGHGTHVAGIIAGEWRGPNKEGNLPVAISRFLKSDTNDVEYQSNTLDGISGMAPQCRLVSLRVLDENGKGAVSNLIAAINHIQEINGHGRRLLIHGVNMSVGYNFEPEWFACGQSPLCVEVNRLVKSGVVVVVAAGNTGYGTLKSSTGANAAGMALTINDPGNADLAITVGSTHRDMPHIYGVSYFSSKGPTGDGRLKPDLVAPGEKIVSCAAGHLKSDGANNLPCDYVETSGTSMAAPHVSGVIAAFLSVRGEFIGQAERVKQIFLSSATDLRRDRYFQGAGLVDLMRAIQSI